MDFRATCSLQDMDYKTITYKYTSIIICNIVKFQLSEHEETHVTLHLRESTVSRCRTKKKEPSFFFARVLHGMRCIRPFAFVRKLKAEGFRPGVALQGWVSRNGME